MLYMDWFSLALTAMVITVVVLAIWTGRFGSSSTITRRGTPAKYWLLLALCVWFVIGNLWWIASTHH